MAGGRGVKHSSWLFWADDSDKSFSKPYPREPETGETMLNEPGLPLSDYPTSATSQHSTENAPANRRVDNRKPSSTLTGRQIVYMAGLHGVGAFVISGGINFIVAYGMLPRY